MAEHKVQGGNMLLFIDSTGGTNYNTVVCLTSVGVSDSISVVDASSSCGPDKSPGTLEISYNFEGQHLQDPSSGNISGTDLRILLRSEQTIGWKLSPLVPVAGDEIQEGTGYLSELSSSYAFDSVGTFTGTIQPYGEPTITIYSGGGGSHYVGESFGGGTVAYVNGTGDHGIIIAWNDSTHQNIWGSYGSVIGANNDTLYGGLSDTNLISGLNPTSAARDCRDLTQGGFTDWCLPTPTDWYTMQPNCATLGISTGDTFWTSLENFGDTDNALGFMPIANSTFVVGKNGTGIFIAVRYF